MCGLFYSVVLWWKAVSPRAINSGDVFQPGGLDAGGPSGSGSFSSSERKFCTFVGDSLRLATWKLPLPVFWNGHGRIRY